MPDMSPAVAFDCYNCEATYKVVRVEAPPEPTTNCEIFFVAVAPCMAVRGISFSNISSSDAEEGRRQKFSGASGHRR
jgi:hypothetical protein